MLRYFIAVSLLLMLAACGGAPDSETTSDADDTTNSPATVEQVDAQNSEGEDDTNTAEETPFVLNVTGAETFDFEANPVFGCVEDEMSIITFTQSPKLDIYFKSDIEAGTYSLATFDANAGAGSVEEAVVATVTGEISEDDGRSSFYFTEPEGEFIIKEMPTEAGEQFVATLSGNLTDSDGDTVTIFANFNIETSGTYFMDCAF